MRTPPSVQTRLLSILRYGLLNIRHFAESGNSDRCAVEANHLHNIPGLLSVFSIDRLKFYINVEIPQYIREIDGQVVHDIRTAWSALEDWITMANKYPDSWAALEHPGYRSDLLGYLSEIANSLPGSDSASDDFDIDCIYHFFFDDTYIGDSSESSVGLCLFDSDEERAVRRVVERLDGLHGEVGDRETSFFLAHRYWPEVKELAKNALIKLSERGIPSYLKTL